MSRKIISRAGFIAATAGVAGLLGAGTAAAHVTANIYGDAPKPGGTGAIVLRVPNEENDAGTTKVEINLPAEYGIGSARAKQLPGWTAEVTKQKLPAPVRNGKNAEISEPITKITWTAQGDAKIAAGSTAYQEFSFTAGPLPTNQPKLVLPASQTYDNGKVVNWDAPPAPAGAPEPEHPAPTVNLSASGGDNQHGSASGGSSGSASEPTAGADSTARWLGGAGLAVGALGLGFGAGATVRARRGNRSSGNPTNGEATE